jgi:hypothetical protein
VDSKGFVRRYRPEIVATVGLIIYTIVRTILVAQGISPVSSASWEWFLFIEIITTAPYVWAVGNIVRHTMAKRSSTASKDSQTKRVGVFLTAALSFAAPYVYLLANGALNTSQGATVFIVILGLFILPRVLRWTRSLWRRYR